MSNVYLEQYETILSHNVSKLCLKECLCLTYLKWNAGVSTVCNSKSMHGIHPFLKTWPHHLKARRCSTIIHQLTVHNTFIVYRGSARFLHLGSPKLGIMGTKWRPVISPDRVCGGQSSRSWSSVVECMPDTCSSCTLIRLYMHIQNSLHMGSLWYSKPHKYLTQWESWSA